MGRKKQARPHRSGGLVLNDRNSTGEAEVTEQKASETEKGENKSESQPYFVDVDRACWASDEHLDISEIVITNLHCREGFLNYSVTKEFYEDMKYCIRFRVCNLDDFAVRRIKLGHWPVVSASDVFMEITETVVSEGLETISVILSGNFDGPDEGITGLLHLASLKFVTVRLLLGETLSTGSSSLRVRVEMLKIVFNSCQSLIDPTRHLWKKSMMNIMAWLRPEVTTSEAKYHICKLAEMDIDLLATMGEAASIMGKCVRFDVAGFYEAIKPSKEEPMLEVDMPDLLPELRPYQRRAAYWMVHREKGYLNCMNEAKNNELCSPLCVPVKFVDTNMEMFYNPFSGNVLLESENSSPYVFGGILADEMGLGKTVELLACIFAHRKSASEGGILTVDEFQATGDAKTNIKRLRRERVECICGSVSESRKYKGLWVQCDICDAWQHADCVGYCPNGKAMKSREESRVARHGRKKPKADEEKRICSGRKSTPDIVVRDGEHICHTCSELLEAADSPVATGATLIVCPAPILPQWHTEIMRHTRPGSLGVFIYEGVRNASLTNASVKDLSELAGADIVLTTYDVLREDLSHDSDRNEGDRHFLRFQKRYPVIPTPLTRIYWWRVCLDEAQMVESNAATATEMALRLYSRYRWCITGTPIQRRLDDLYGLLKFLKAGPFDVLRWWTEVIRDPYERRDKRAMEFTHNFFKKIMWRSTKVHVADELQLPPQEESVSWLSFSPIEEHFYQRQHETCMSCANELIENLREDICKREIPGNASFDTLSDPLVTHVEAAKLLNSLLKLRQACCHPQVGSSGLRSLQNSPMTMEEILMVLVGKTKIEGEEALRRLVVALNALAAIAIIQNNHSEAVALYKEALALAKEHSEDFRLDPLLNIHIHHNLFEMIALTSSNSQELSSEGQELSGRPECKASKIFDREQCDLHIAKRRKVIKEDHPVSATDNGELLDMPSVSMVNGYQECDFESQISSHLSCKECIRLACEDMKQKYLSVFKSKLSLAKQEFRKSYLQVCDGLNVKSIQDNVWWLEALHHVEGNNLASELIRKVGEAVSSSLDNSKSSRIASWFRSITALKYHVQTRLDQLEASRAMLLDRLLEIDQTMEKPREEDIQRVRYCSNCQPNGDGPSCIHCELDELFQVYEARLFRLNKSHGEAIVSAEEAVDLQKRNSALNRFLWNLSNPSKNPTSFTNGNEETVHRRDVGRRVVVSKSSSEVEVALGVIRSYCKPHLGTEAKQAAVDHLLLLESMRKEYAHARSLAIAQAQVLRAYDEIKMATSRLRLRENENDKSIDALNPEELVSANVEHTHEKFLSLRLLSNVKGKLRYLKGLVHSKLKATTDGPNNPLVTEEGATAVQASSGGQINESLGGCDEERCPVCQEKLTSQKMVFQCGHVTCCRCLFALTEKRLAQDGKFQNKWVMCPTCRQHTDFSNIAYADDGQHKSSIQHTFQDHEKKEAAITVQGSYGTKIEAVTRRILWIKFTYPKAKIVVFSSWNDVLDVLAHALTVNSITHIRMKGGRKSQIAIKQFREQPTHCESERKFIQVLLLLIQHGANGLNLLEAQHVILVEPLLNPAAEAQAISRVHRIGQEKKTLVHRFMVKGTVEEGIYKLNKSRNTSSFISGNTKNQDQPVLTLKDIEALFAVSPPTAPEKDEKSTENLMHLPPSVAAAIAAERRLKRLAT